MKTTCPHCGQHLEGDDSLAGTSVECPGCGKSFKVPMMQPSGVSDQPPIPEKESADDDLEEANRFLERMIGNVFHAIWGIFCRIWQVVRFLAKGLLDAVRWFFERLLDIIRFFFSYRFAKFLVLLVVLAMLLAVLCGIVAGPFLLWLWIRRAKAIAPQPENDPFWWFSHADDIAFAQATIIETIWIVLIAGWGILRGIQSYRRGVIARWRARWKERRAARRDARQAERNAD